MLRLNRILRLVFPATALVFMLWLIGGTAWAQSGVETAIEHSEGKLANGAKWMIDVPKRWNGTLLLFSHGYGGGPDAPLRNASSDTSGKWLLDHGYALAASSFSKGGWSVEEGLSDQIVALDVFAEKFGKPKRTIAWGFSMGGLLTLGLLERNPKRFDGGLCLCGSVGGGVGMLNIGLDGAFAVKMLLAPDSSLQLVGIRDERANNQLAQTILNTAQSTPEGRARIALAAALGQVALWGRDKPEVAADDYAGQELNQYKSFPGAVFTPRRPLEERAGGNFSWNTGVDYRRQLELSGRRSAVQALYRQAGLDLEKDLQKLNDAPRISADPKAVAYMKRNFVPAGEIQSPVLSMTSPGDDATSFAHEQALESVVRPAGKGALLRQVFVRRPGHCVFSTAELVTAILTLERRIERGDWEATTTPEALNKLAESLALDGAQFISVAPPKFLRPCTGREKKCEGEP